VGDRDAGDQHRPPDVGPDHQPPPLADAIQPDAGHQRQQQMREQPSGGQIAHLGRIGAEHQDCDERDRDAVDLVAEHRDRLAGPQVAEIGHVPEQAGHESMDDPHR
jgi:hypothetical protein